MCKTAEEAQQQFAEFCGHNDDIIWDLYNESDSNLLQSKLKSLFGDGAEDMRSVMFESIWNQRKHNNGSLLSTIIYALVTKAKNYQDALKSTDYSCHVVFRIRKCLKNGSARGCCCIFVDDRGQVYMDTQSLNDLFKIYKRLGNRNIRFNFARNGAGILLNNEIPIDPKTFRQILQTSAHESVLNLLKTCVPDLPMNENKRISSKQLFGETRREEIALKKAESMGTQLKDATVEVIDKLSDLLKVGDNFKEIVERMLNELPAEICTFMLDLAAIFQADYVEKIEKIIKRVITLDEILYQINKICLQFKEISLQYLEKMKDYILEKLKSFFESFKTIPSGKRITCATCGGTYTIVDL